MVKENKTHKRLLTANEKAAARDLSNRFNKVRLVTQKDIKNPNLGLKAETINLMNTDFKSVTRKALENLTEALEAKENWATQLYWKSIFNCIFDKSWLNQIDVSAVDVSINSLNDIARVCTELSTVLLSSNNKTISANDLQDIIKLLSSLKPAENIMINSVSGLSDDKLKQIVELMYPVKNVN